MPIRNKVTTSITTAISHQSHLAIAEQPCEQSLLTWHNGSRFLALLMIWSLTPLAVVVSVKGLPPLWALATRFLLAAPLAHGLLKILGERLPLNLQALKSYVAGALGVYVAMMLTYLAAVQLPSSMISMIFGLSPMVSGMIGLLVYKKQLHKLQWLGISLALLGLILALGLISGSFQVPQQSLGLVCSAMLLSVVSLYLVNHVQQQADLRQPTKRRRPRFANALTIVRLVGVQAKLSPVHNNNKPHVSLTPLNQTVGVLWVSFVGVFMLLPFIWHTAPTHLPPADALIAIGFLVVFSSLLAFVFLYALNSRVSPTSVSMVMIITPILAAIWGAWLNHEQIAHQMLFGLALIVMGLSLFVWGAERVQKNSRPAIS